MLKREQYELMHGVCAKYGAKYLDPLDIYNYIYPFSKKKYWPINWLRIYPEWYSNWRFIYHGMQTEIELEESYKSISYNDMIIKSPELRKYLWLWPWRRFQIWPWYEDVWYDKEILNY